MINDLVLFYVPSLLKVNMLLCQNVEEPTAIVFHGLMFENQVIIIS